MVKFDMHNYVFRKYLIQLLLGRQKCWLNKRLVSYLVLFRITQSVLLSLSIYISYIV